MKKTIFFLGLMVFATVFLTGCVSNDQDKAKQLGTGASDSTQQERVYPEENLVEIVTQAGKFSVLLSLVEKAELVEYFNTQELTLFAPTDDAFAKLEAGELDILSADPKKLADFLKYHLLGGRVWGSELSILDVAATVSGKTIEFKRNGDEIFVGGAKITQTEILAKNGVIHVIDSVLMQK